MTWDAGNTLDITDTLRGHFCPRVNAVVLDAEFSREGYNATGFSRHFLNDLAHVGYSRLSLQWLSIAYVGANSPTLNKKNS